MIPRSVLSLVRRPLGGPDAAMVQFACLHGLVTLPYADGENLLTVASSALSLHDQFQAPACTVRAWQAVQAGELPDVGAAISPN